MYWFQLAIRLISVRRLPSGCAPAAAQPRAGVADPQQRVAHTSHRGALHIPPQVPGDTVSSASTHGGHVIRYWRHSSLCQYTRRLCYQVLETQFRLPVHTAAMLSDTGDTVPSASTHGGYVIRYWRYSSVCQYTRLPCIQVLETQFRQLVLRCYPFDGSCCTGARGNLLMGPGMWASTYRCWSMYMCWEHPVDGFCCTGVGGILLMGSAVQLLGASC